MNYFISTGDIKMPSYTLTTTGGQATIYLQPIEDEEVITIKITKKKYLPYQACAFDNWDWEKYPVAHLVCTCPKCSPRY